MRRSGLYFVFFAFAMCFIAMTSQAQAQATRTWVSGVGDDANPCSRTAPCKTFPGAYSRTAVGGEIDALDPGGFGTISISKSITIDGGGGDAGQVASILASSTNGVVINGAAGDNVILRNLDINGISNSSFPGLNGIVFNSGNSLTLQRVNIMNFSQFCINTVQTAGNHVNLQVENSILQNCTSGGIHASNPAAPVSRVTVTRSTITRMGAFGVNANANVFMMVFNSSISGCGGGGVLSDSATGNVSIDASTITQNQAFGVHASNNSTIRMSNTSISFNNGTGVLADPGAQILTWGNNWVAGNSPDGARTGPITPI
jgi:hypothetical protein